jgi:hypothetical protein
MTISMLLAVHFPVIGPDTILLAVVLCDPAPLG